MTLQLSSAAFRRAINLACLAVERRNSIPILDGVHCKANGTFAVTGTDLDLAVTAEVERVPGADAAFVLDTPRQVATVLAAAGGTDVALSQNDRVATLASDALSLSAKLHDDADFPADLARPLDVKLHGTLSRENITQITRVFGAVSTEETRYYLNGIALEKTGPTTIRAAATDGHRLYFADIEVPDLSGDIKGTMIVPRKLLSILFNIGKASTDGVRLEIGPQAASNRTDSTAPDRSGLPRIAASVTMRDANVRLCGKLIDGTFPDYRRVIPTVAGKQALFKVAELRRAVSAVSGHSRNMRATKLVFKPGRVIVSAAFIDIGLSASVTVPCEHQLGAFEIGYNGGYLADLLNASGGDEIVFSISDASSPAMVRNPANPNWGAVIMPMRVS